LWCDVGHLRTYGSLRRSLNRLQGESPMLRDRYEPMDLFALVPELSLAMEPVLA
jgi:hypothetical protein